MITRKYFETRRFLATDQHGKQHTVIEEGVLVINPAGRPEPAKPPFVYQTVERIELRREGDTRFVEIEGSLVLMTA